MRPMVVSRISLWMLVMKRKKKSKFSSVAPWMQPMFICLSDLSRCGLIDFKFPKKTYMIVQFTSVQLNFKEIEHILLQNKNFNSSVKVECDGLSV